jgi:virginiamycin A acetyltransferase
LNQLKAIFKAAAGAAAIVCVLPAVGLCRAGGAIGGPQRAFAGWSQAMSLLPGLLGVYLRRAFYAMAAQQCGEDVCISFGTVFSHPTVSLARKVYLGVYCVIGDATLEDDVLIGSHVSIMNGAKQHGIDRLDIPVREQPGEWPRITIGRDSWIGDRAVVMADVGKHCVVGAGSVVTKPVPDYAIVVGNPGRVVRYRTDSEARDSNSNFRELAAADSNR